MDLGLRVSVSALAISSKSRINSGDVDVSGCDFDKSYFGTGMSV